MPGGELLHSFQLLLLILHLVGRRILRPVLPAIIHMVCDANGVPLRFMLSAGQATDIAHAQPLLDQVRILGKPGRPRKRSRSLLADKGYGLDYVWITTR